MHAFGQRGALGQVGRLPGVVRGVDVPAENLVAVQIQHEIKEEPPPPHQGRHAARATCAVGARAPLI